MNIDKETLISQITPQLKTMGYKKRNNTWAKQSDPEMNIFIVINIQGSQYDKKDYYINLGVYIQALGQKNIPTCISDCQMQERITVEINSSELLLKIIEKWENTYGLYNQIYDKVLENKMPKFTDKKLYSYFLVNGRKQ
jgi:hypothetical protein